MGKTLADASAAAESKPWRLGVSKGLGSLASEISRKGAKRRNLFEVDGSRPFPPRVAHKAAQPGAGGRNPVGIGDWETVSLGVELRTR